MQNTFVRKLHICHKMHRKELEQLYDKVKAYGLIRDLFETVQPYRKDGVSRRTIYKALTEGPKTYLLEIILTHAKNLVTQHEANFLQTKLENANSPA